MLRVNWPTERTGKGAPGKSSPADFAFTCPRPPLRSFTKEYSNKKAPLKPLRRQRGLCRFFGANSVASALGIRSGATPCGLIQPNIQLRNTRSKPDILTLLGLGHFYFALTGSPFRIMVAGGWARIYHASGEGGDSAQSPGQILEFLFHFFDLLTNARPALSAR